MTIYPKYNIGDLVLANINCGFGSNKGIETYIGIIEKLEIEKDDSGAFVYTYGISFGPEYGAYDTINEFDILEVYDIRQPKVD